MFARITLLAALVLLLPTVCIANDESSSLAEQLRKMAAQARDRMSAEMLEKMARGIDDVRETGIEQSARQVGEVAPDGTLTSWDGAEVRLSDLWTNQPVVLTWYRGGWCPYCNLQMRAMQKSLEDLKGAGAKLVAITPELPENAKETAEKNNLGFLVLHDQENKLAHEYGLVFQLSNSIAPLYRDRLRLHEVNGYKRMELPLAATYVVDREGVIRWAFLDADYKKRAEPADVVEAVKQLNTNQEQD